jgi:hypothetical protein
MPRGDPDFAGLERQGIKRTTGHAVGVPGFSTYHANAGTVRFPGVATRGYSSRRPGYAA